jgi:hypothetical protein
VRVFPWVLLSAPLIVLLHLTRKISDVYKTGPFEKWGRWMGISGGGGKDHDEAAFTWNIDSISAAPTTGTCLEPLEESHPPFRNSHGNLPNQDQRSSKHGAIDGDRNDTSKSTDITNEEDTPRMIARARALQSTRKQRPACCEDNILPSSPSGEPSLASKSGHSARVDNETTLPEESEFRWSWTIRNKEPGRLILCNGKQLRVGINLYNVLREIPASAGQLWWVDTICIDQTNITERGQQVNIMAQIYRNAEEVIVWLRMSSNFTKKAVSFLASLPSFTEGNNRRPDQCPRGTSSYSLSRETMLGDTHEVLRRHKTKCLRSCLLFVEPGLKECRFYKRQCCKTDFISFGTAYYLLIRTYQRLAMVAASSAATKYIAIPMDFKPPCQFYDSATSTLAIHTYNKRPFP